MIDGKRVCVVMPAYNAGRTLERTAAEIDRRLVDQVLVVDDASADETALVARRLGLPCIVHPRNRGYGGNQKTCYREALAYGADIVVMLHPDYQYSPRLLPALVSMIASGHFDVALGSRILGVGALAGGMPSWKYAANRLLTFAENVLLGHKLAEYHTGYRAFSRRVLEELPLHANSDDFVFDNQMLAEAIWAGFAVGEVSCPARYFAEASSINFSRSVRYGFGVLGTALEFRLARWGWILSERFPRELQAAAVVVPPVAATRTDGAAIPLGHGKQAPAGRDRAARPAAVAPARAATSVTDAGSTHLN
jgi:glycosyltransferase involved in cell wall biosynthesis